MLARRYPCVVEIPQLRALITWVPLTELITKRKDSLLSACLFLVAPCPTKSGVELELFNCAEQCWNLQPVAASIGAARLRRNTCSVSYTHLRAHETGRNLVCRLLL